MTNDELAKHIDQKFAELTKTVLKFMPPRTTRIGDVEMVAKDPARQLQLNKVSYLANTNNKDYAWVKQLSIKIGNHGEVYDMTDWRDFSALIDAMYNKLGIQQDPNWKEKKQQKPAEVPPADDDDIQF